MAEVPIGQAPQALVFVSSAAGSGDGTANLVPRANEKPVNVALKPAQGDAYGFVVARNLGLVDSLEVSLFKLKPDTTYDVYVGEQRTPVASFKTNPKGMANGTAIGPMREAVSRLAATPVTPSAIYVVEHGQPAEARNAVLTGKQ
ncbi:MAG TPA: hypothetical protein VFP36_05680 [Usitatibacter sp.]|nr:hypothetical protein [Usitatibacter sp.]